MPKVVQREKRYWYSHGESECYGIMKESELQSITEPVDILGEAVKGTIEELKEICGESFQPSFITHLEDEKHA